MTDPTLPELDADVIADPGWLGEVVDAAVEYLATTDPTLVHVISELRLQRELLLSVAPDLAGQQLVIDELTNAAFADLSEALVQWAFTAGLRSATRGTR